jgi:hypothetical protein
MNDNVPIEGNCLEEERSDDSKICGGREKVGKSKMLIFQGNDSKFHIIPKIL